MEDANWVYVSGLRYQKLDCVGRGGSSKVFKVLACNRQIYALKRVRFSNKDPEAICGFIEEITLLKKLRNTPNIIQLISAQVRCCRLLFLLVVLLALGHGCCSTTTADMPR